ncbi:hypothetical protein ACLHZU_03650 [Aeromonas salmonicida]|uniref:hypothetical protein n=1 Tax=Aeromonas salmonicida TaxID=645 RepID=UPI003D067252
MDELLPFLKGDISPKLEHELVKKSQSLLGMTKSKESKEHLISIIDETLIEEIHKEDKDDYLIMRLCMIKGDIQRQIEQLNIES